MEQARELDAMEVFYWLAMMLLVNSSKVYAR
jgi:hypothetical protein